MARAVDDETLVVTQPNQRGRAKNCHDGGDHRGHVDERQSDES
jgi:hypothetical protein